MTIDRIEITGREQWLAHRHQDVTASDVGAVFGLHPYKSPLQLWIDKTTPGTDTIENSAMRRGRWLEDAVVAACRDTHPDWTIRKPGVYLRDPQIRLGATPDAVADTPDGELIIQCKTVAEPVFKSAWPDGPPQQYYLQALTEAMLWGAPRALLAVLIVSAFGADYMEYPVERHARAEQRIKDGVIGFWKSIAAGVMPKPDYTQDGELLARLYGPDDKLPPIDLTSNNRLPELLDERAKLMADAKYCEERLDAIKAEVIDAMQGATVATLPGWNITRKLTHRGEYVVKAMSYPTLRITRQKEKTP
jgi:putative phage-type endonuclease